MRVLSYRYRLALSQNRQQQPATSGKTSPPTRAATLDGERHARSCLFFSRSPPAFVACSSHCFCLPLPKTVPHSGCIRRNLRTIWCLTLVRTLSVARITEHNCSQKDVLTYTPAPRPPPPSPSPLPSMPQCRLPVIKHGESFVDETLLLCRKSTGTSPRAE